MDVEILKVIVGSQAHGTATPESDHDYRGVFIVPTENIVKLGTKVNNNHWLEGDIDNTAYELGHFLHLATQCNPTLMEVFNAPVISSTALGQELRGLFPYTWSKKRVLDSHLGYSCNQRKKFTENKDMRWGKYVQAWLRTVYQAWHLFVHNEYVVDFKPTIVYETLVNMRRGYLSRGECLEICEAWEQTLKDVYDRVVENPELSLEKVNKFLVDARYNNYYA